MDTHYDHKLAAIAIEHWNEKLSEVDAPFSAIGLTMPASRVDVQPTQINVVRDVPGGGARTVFHGNTGAEIEAVCTVVGALNVKDLPPVPRFQARTTGPKRLRQHATIVGYDSRQFQRALDNIQIVAFEMSRAFKDDELRIWRPANDEAPTGPALSANCRYFTLGTDVATSQETAFDGMVDPHDALKDMLASTVHHCYDNEVSYLTMENGTYVSHPPNAFKVGDIVEMGFTISAWRFAANNNGPRFSTSLVLRTLTFLDGKYSMDAAFRRMDAQQRPTQHVPSPPVIRNQIAFRIAKRKEQQREAEEENGEPGLRRKMSKMAIGSTSTL
ncbi:hypothetical protein B0H12DRAFT_1234818 [Mycena haematopus]|nr:hypothetical protein B0H12DRAFT_1234818 [Mycena haematopus]